MAQPAARALRPSWMSRGELLAWSWAREQLATERNYWVSTVQQSGRPHSRPVWGVWVDDVLYLSIGEAGFRHAVKGPDGSVEVSVHTDSAEQVVILDGSAVRLGKGDERRKAAELYGEKYGSQYGDVTNFRVEPRVAYGWQSNWDGETHGTHWTFAHA